MQPRYLPLVQIFGAPARYTVPLFQRPYVWNKEEQWEPLWDDISHLADRVLAAGPGTAVAGHFLGTVVLEQTMTPAGTIGCREIIDGQQRLTTLQILLKAAEHVLATVKATANAQADEAGAKAADVAARQVGILTANAAYSEDEEKYKVWPTNDDRAAFRLVMDAVGSQTLASDPSRMAETYRYFHGTILSWIGQGPHTGARATALAGALQSHIKLIVLDLDDSDEPQAIFETLNAHGTPLLPSDLIKNWLLWEASRQKLGHVEKLYQTWWRGFDADPQYWRAKIGTGHAARPRIDTFLQNWLTRRTGDLVPPKHLYARFLAHVSTPEMPVDIPALMEGHPSRRRLLPRDRPASRPHPARHILPASGDDGHRRLPSGPSRPYATTGIGRHRQGSGGGDAGELPGSPDRLRQPDPRLQRRHENPAVGRRCVGADRAGGAGNWGGPGWARQPRLWLARRHSVLHRLGVPALSTEISGACAC